MRTISSTNIWDLSASNAFVLGCSKMMLILFQCNTPNFWNKLVLRTRRIFKICSRMIIIFCSEKITKWLILVTRGWMGDTMVVFKCAKAADLCGARTPSISSNPSASSIRKTPSFGLCQVDMYVWWYRWTVICLTLMIDHYAWTQQCTMLAATTCIGDYLCDLQLWHSVLHSIMYV